MNSKRLLINGSPNTNGYSMQCAEAILEGYAYDVIKAYDVNITSCDDCKVCHHVNRCKHKDDMQMIIDQIEQIDTLILVTPVYFGAMTDQMLKLINRFQLLFEAKYTHKTSVPTLKNLLIVSTCAATDESMFDGIRLTSRILKELFSVEKLHLFTALNTDHTEDIIASNRDKITLFKETIKKDFA